MSYRCVVVDDERPARERLKRLLGAHADFEVVGEAADAAAAVARINELEPDLCFLDVQMPEGDGFDVLARVTYMPAVIFTTAFDQYAVRAFEVHSLDYLLKPFGKKRFAEALDRARERLGEPADEQRRVVELLERIGRDLRGGAREDGPPQKISARRGARIVLLDSSEVLWFEAEETLVFARSVRGRFLVEHTLTELEQQFEPGFFRAHRRFLVNLTHVSEIVPGEAGTYSIVLRGEEPARVPLSRRQARKLRERIPW
jgi:two-component system LytT family response regulator